MAVDSKSLLEAADDFVQVLDDCFGLCLDSHAGFKSNFAEVTKHQESTVERLRAKEPSIQTVADLDRLPFSHGKGDPNDPTNILYHQCTQAEYKDRNQDGGKNSRIIIRYGIALIYEYWESEFRGRFEAALDLKPGGLKHDLFGDLRFLRQAIIHHKGIATKDCERLKVFTPIPRGQEIAVSVDELYVIVRAIRATVDELCLKATGTDPIYRTIWHVR